MMSRRQQAQQIRNNAAEIAANRPHPIHKSNGEEYKYRRPKRDGKGNEPSYIANFTKGLPHHPDTGLLLNSADYDQFVLGIQSGDPKDFAKTPLGPADLPKEIGCLSQEKITCDTENRQEFWESGIAQEAEPEECDTENRQGSWKSKIAQKANQEKDEKDDKAAKGAKLRAWESAGAGLTFDLQGPDAQAVTMPPAPTLDSVELAAEIAEIYLQALVRDIHFSQLQDPSIVQEVGVRDNDDNDDEDNCKEPVTKVEDAITILNNIKIICRNWFASECCELSDEERARHRSPVNRQNIFRGITPGEEKGPYLSQFLLIGNEGINSNNSDRKQKNGLISYGSIRIAQKVRFATPFRDYMTNFKTWLDVQNGADVRGLECYVNDKYRFITTPRDLATYVHYDALYEAYLNACLIMLGMGVPFDPGIPFQKPDVEDKQQGFAQFGGPQILSLVCEVATRALKAVRYQKFNVHRRLRPEALAGLIDRYKKGIGTDNELKPLAKLVEALDEKLLPGKSLLDLVAEHNRIQNKDCNDDNGVDNYFLPMAFPEGSPMHPSYGAGHATVAGACVTMLKAFFDHSFELNFGKQGERYIAYESNKNGKKLNRVTIAEPLTVEGELNKIAANISIGRDWAGVHYFTDYIESVRLGEKIAIGILEEQKLTYGENFTMTVPLFDGGTIRI